MTGKGHYGVGVVLTIPCYYLAFNLGFGYIISLLCSLGVVLGARAPDYLEISYNKGRGRKTIFKHRGLTHWWLIWVLPFIVIYSLLSQDNFIYQYLITTNTQFFPFNGIEYGYLLLLGFLIGGISHLLTDLPNKRGIPLFTPFDYFCLKLWNSGEFEKTIIFIFLIGSIYYINLFDIQNHLLR